MWLLWGANHDLQHCTAGSHGHQNGVRNALEQRKMARRVWIAGLIEEILEKYWRGGDVPEQAPLEDEEDLPACLTAQSGKKESGVDETSLQTSWRTTSA